MADAATRSPSSESPPGTSLSQSAEKPRRSMRGASARTIVGGRRADEADRDRRAHGQPAYAPTSRTAPPSTPFAPCSKSVEVAVADRDDARPARRRCPCAPRADDRGSRGLGGDDGEEADAEIPGALGRLEVEAAEVGEHAEHGRRRPGRPVDLDPRAARQHAREVGGDAAAGDVAERVHGRREPVVVDEAQQRPRVEPRRLEQRLAPRRAEVGGAIAVLDAGAATMWRTSE